MLSESLSLHWSDIFGIGGVVIYVGSYFALQAGLISGRGYLYPSLNIVAAGSVLLSLTHNLNLASAAIQVTFIAISVFGISRFYLVTQRAKFSEEEQTVRELLIPNLHRADARRLMALGSFRDLEVGSSLTEEHAVVPSLYVLVSGVAAVSVNGRQIASLGDRSLIGEMSALSGTPASATVTVSALSRVFEIDRTSLNAYLAKNDATRHELQGRFLSQISDKLIVANRKLSEQARD